MLQKLEGLNSYRVFELFKQMNEIPRGSGNEQAISDWLVEFAKKNGLEVIQDEALNVIIRKPGTEGYENSQTVVLQGHMDMVCEKNQGTEHDFEKDPIKFIIDGEMLRADGTTLGADNGVAVAYGLAVLESKDIAHPPIEVLVTTEEETGMGGALALDADNIKGKMLINIDSGVEGELLVSCAGGVRQVVTLPVEKETATKTQAFHIKIRGLKGGHSGVEIDQQRGNSNKLMGRFLNEVKNELDFDLATLSGGAKMNAIPREADATIVVEDDVKIKELVTKWNEVFKAELAATDKGVELSIEESDKVEEVMTKATRDKVLTFINLIPNGVQTMSKNIEGLVESSTNIGVVTTYNNEIVFESAVRSSVDTLKESIVRKGEILSETLGAEFKNQSPYPAWPYKEDSRLREVMSSSYKELFDKEMNIEAIHAGLECGLFSGKFGTEMDMVSFGPNMYDIHTPEERVEIASVDRCWSYLLKVLENLK